MPPRVFISYSHDSPEHEARVLDLANALRAHGIDAWIDQYEPNPPGGWPRWMEDRLTDPAALILLICTPTFLERVRGLQPEGTGRGVMWEGNLIYNLVYEARNAGGRFLPILLDGTGTENDVPLPLRSQTSYSIKHVDLDDSQYTALYRHLTGQPATPLPSLGELQVLPPISPIPAAPQTKPWNVPMSRTQFFTGRVAELAALHAALATGKPAALTQAISGLGGIGKTQTAVEYAHLHRDEYDAVFWVSAASPESITSGFAAIAALLQLPEANAQDQNVAVAAAKRWLQSNGRWLLILDNADDADIARTAVLDAAPGHVLITSRLQSLRGLGVASPVVLHEMPPDDAITFLLNSTGRRGIVDAAVAELAKELGYLPLAMEQAAAYIAASGASFADYLVSYRRNKLKVLDKSKPQAGGYRDTVRVTWSMNFEAVKQESKAAADVLNLTAFLGPDAIPYEILIKGAGEISEAVSKALDGVADDPLLLDDLLLPLTRYCLIHRDPATRSYTMHRLVQLVIQDGLSDDDRRVWAERAVLAVNRAFPDPLEFANWFRCESLLPATRACEVHIVEYGIETGEASLLLSKAALYIEARGLYAHAITLFQCALAIDEKVLGPEHLNTAITLGNLAYLHENQGDYVTAELLYKRALKIKENVLGSEHPITATSLNNMAGLYISQGDYTTAELLYKRAQDIWKKKLGVEHSDTALSLNNQAAILFRQGNYTAAEPLYMRALEIDEKVNGAEHPDTATSLNNLAYLYGKLGDYSTADPLIERALQIREKALGPEHPTTTETLSNYAYLLRTMGRDAEAAVLEARAVAGRAEHERRNRS